MTASKRVHSSAPSGGEANDIMHIRGITSLRTIIWRISNYLMALGYHHAPRVYQAPSRRAKIGMSIWQIVSSHRTSTSYFSAILLCFLINSCSSLPNNLPYSKTFLEETSELDRLALRLDRGSDDGLDGSRKPQAGSYLGPDIWTLIAEQYDFAPQHYDDPLVRKHISYLQRRPDFIKGVNERSSLFVYHIMEKIHQRGMPMELVLLPAVESGYDPFAYSSAGASGLWQFIESTGNKFGLDNIWWYSDRRSFEKSTDAALDYLQYLHAKYDDWELSLAAYNAGERRVNNAIRYNKARGLPTDYWALKSLPRETENYVPRLIAFSYIFTKEQRDKLGLRTIPANQPLVKVEVSHQLPMAEIVEAAGIDEEKFYLLNAGHNQWVTSPYKQQLYILSEDHSSFMEALDNFAVDAPLWISYKLEDGDNLSKIAQKFNLSEDVIRKFNQVDLLEPGYYVVLPIPNSEILPELAQGDSPPRHLIDNDVVLDYKIKSGDNLYSIARTYRVSVAKLQRMNDIENPHQIQTGQRIVVDEDVLVKQPSILLASAYDRQVMRSVYYRVRRGDNLYRIAGKFNTEVEQIKEWNSHRSLGNIIYPGQVIRLRLDVTDL